MFVRQNCFEYVLKKVFAPFQLNFMRVWRDKYPNVVIPKNHRFTECKTFSHLKAVPKGKPEVSGSDVFDQKKVNILQEIVSWYPNVTFSISET